MAQIEIATTEAIAKAANVLRSGQLVAFPTETVYGLGGAARSPAAVGRIYDLKGRPRGHPVIVHLPDAGHIHNWAADVPPVVFDLTAKFWPGPLTLVLAKRADVPAEVTGGQGTVALRMPAHPTALALLTEFGDGIAAPSANRFGHVSPTTAQHVAADFDEPLLVLDGGACQVGLESTILDLSQFAQGNGARLLRPGGVSVAQLESVLGTRVQLPGEWGAVAPRVPGSLDSHYAAKAPSALISSEKLAESVVSGQALVGAAVMALGAHPDGALASESAGHWLQMPADAEQYARAMYSALRTLDALQPDRILIEAVPAAPEWAAIRDRLTRATTEVIE